MSLTCFGGPMDGEKMHDLIIEFYPTVDGKAGGFYRREMHNGDERYVWVSTVTPISRTAQRVRNFVTAVLRFLFLFFFLVGLFHVGDIIWHTLKTNGIK